jgi:hypothetical protein
MVELMALCYSLILSPLRIKEIGVEYQRDYEYATYIMLLM